MQIEILTFGVRLSISSRGKCDASIASREDKGVTRREKCPERADELILRGLESKLV